MKVFRVLQTAGMALWVGGQFFGVVALPAAAEVLPRRRDRQRVINAGWDAWAPMSLAALSATALGCWLEMRSTNDPGERKRATLRLASAVAGLASTGAGSLLGIAMKKQLQASEGYPTVRNESGLPVVYLPGRPALRKSMIPVNAVHAISALGLVLTPP